MRVLQFAGQRSQGHLSAFVRSVLFFIIIIPLAQKQIEKGESKQRAND
jgi:hypothetical protein